MLLRGDPQPLLRAIDDADLGLLHQPEQPFAGAESSPVAGNLVLGPLKTSAPRRQLSPRVASKNKWRRIEALQRNKAWLAAYRAAFARLRAGFGDAVFPAGTYELFRLSLVACHPL